MLLDDQILANLNDVQLRNGLKPTESLATGDFTVEMETGTGKTYVYLRSILELNRRFGFTKIVIVVPSVAIKEGVYKTLQITEDGGVPGRLNEPRIEGRSPLLQGICRSRLCPATPVGPGSPGTQPDWDTATMFHLPFAVDDCAS
jgi:hypothetical protein